MTQLTDKDHKVQMADMASFDELMANSVGELGAAFLGMMAEGHAEG